MAKRVILFFFFGGFGFVFVFVDILAGGAATTEAQEASEYHDKNPKVNWFHGSPLLDGKREQTHA
jgi:hypothetical protein